MATPGDKEGQERQSLGWEALVPRVTCWWEDKGEAEKAGTRHCFCVKHCLMGMLCPALSSV